MKGPQTQAAHEFLAWLRSADLRTRGVRATSPQAYRYLVAIEAQAAAVSPDQRHPLIDGYCPICNGSCLVGFGNPSDDEAPA